MENIFCEAFINFGIKHYSEEGRKFASGKTLERKC